jgi:hypothetical protein
VFENENAPMLPSSESLYVNERVRVTLRRIDAVVTERRVFEKKVVHVLSGTFYCNGKKVTSTATIMPGIWHSFAGPAEIIEVIHYSE